MSPFERLNQYSTPTPDGGVTISLEQLLVDTILAFKLGGFQLEHIQMAVDETWPKVEVEMEVPHLAKN